VLSGEGYVSESHNFCPNCGTEAAAGFSFCGGCGRSVRKQTTAVGLPASHENSFANTSPISPDVTWNLSEWDEPSQDTLARLLTQSGIPHRWNGLELSADPVYENRVDIILGDLRRGSEPAKTGSSDRWPGAPTRIDNSRLWLLVATPILLVCVDLALALSGEAEGESLGVIITLAVNTVIVIWDSRYLKQHGVEVNPFLGIFLIPLYIGVRSSRLQQSQLPLVCWIAVFVVSLLGTAAVENHFVQLDMSTVRSDITTWVDNRTSTHVAVTCPSRSVYAEHSTFFCTASDSAGRVTVQVTVTDANGDIVWKVIG
jgi:hypothetical protein